MTNNQKGFTLVELSIVLVIIGLLIGGILVAQSMITTTKIQSFTRQVAQFDTSTGTFKTRFNSLPGDSDIYNSAIGDGNGLIANQIDGAAVVDTTLAAGAEVAQFWLQLSNTGLKKEEAGGATYTTSYVAGTGVPIAKVGSSAAGVYVYGESAMTALGTASAANMYIVMDCSEMTSTTLDCKDALNAADAIAVDTKLDDGVGTTGNVRGATGADLAAWSAIVDDTPAAYDPATTAINTKLYIRMGISHGDLY